MLLESASLFNAGNRGVTLKYDIETDFECTPRGSWVLRRINSFTITDWQ